MVSINIEGIQELGSAIGAGLGIFYLRFVETVRRRGKSQAQQIVELKTGQYHIHPALGILYVIGFMQLIVNITTFLVSLGVGMALMLTGFTRLGGELEAQRIAVNASGLPILIVASMAIVPVSIFVAHRLKRQQLFWIVAGLICNTVFSLFVNVLLFNSFFQIALSTELVAQLFVFVLFMLPGAIIGSLRARATQLQHVMSSLFRQLPAEDQRALAELAFSSLSGAPAESFPALANNPVQKFDSTQPISRIGGSAFYLGLGTSLYAALWFAFMRLGEITLADNLSMIYLALAVVLGLVVFSVGAFFRSKYAGAVLGAIVPSVLMWIAVNLAQPDQSTLISPLMVVFLLILVSGAFGLVAMFIAALVMRWLHLELPCWSIRRLSRREWSDLVSAQVGDDS